MIAKPGPEVTEPCIDRPSSDLIGFLPTARHYANNNHVVHVICKKCRGKMILDLEALSRGRHADTALDRLPFRCVACAGREFTVKVEYVGTPQRRKPGRKPSKGSPAV
jgi:hypothetical protein